MKRSGLPARRTRLPRVNRRRQKRRRDAGEVYGPYYVRIANLGTCVGQRGRAPHVCSYFPGRRPEAHHVKHVGAGGKDAANCVDTCHGFHDWAHDNPPSRVTAALGFTLESEALRLYAVHADGDGMPAFLRSLGAPNA